MTVSIEKKIATNVPRKNTKTVLGGTVKHTVRANSLVVVENAIVTHAPEVPTIRGSKGAPSYGSKFSRFHTVLENPAKSFVNNPPPSETELPAL